MNEIEDMRWLRDHHSTTSVWRWNLVYGGACGYVEPLPPHETSISRRLIDDVTRETNRQRQLILAGCP